MSKPSESILDLPLEQRAIRALRAAVKKAIAEHRRVGVPVYVWKNGKVFKLPSESRHEEPRKPPTRDRRGGKAR